jgi:antitoxin StbD
VSLKRSPSSLIEEAGTEAIAILNHNKASAYLVPAQTYEKLMAIVDDYLLSKEIDKRISDGS